MKIATLIPSKSTAFGRVTRRASSDPACFLPETSSAWRAWGVSPETPLPSRVEWPESR